MEAYDTEAFVSQLVASAHASVQFALSCLVPAGAGPDGQVARTLRAVSAFVDPDGHVMHWHDFGDLEGPGWAANALGGALLLARWGHYVGSRAIYDQALALCDHILDDGFVRDDGFVWPYWDLAAARFCANYTHNDTWLCPGSLAQIGVQMLALAEFLEATDGDPLRPQRLRRAAQALGGWLQRHVPRLENGWVPRRITLTGEPHPLTPEGGADPVFDHSADGLFLLDLWARLGTLDDARARRAACTLGDAFVAAGGFWGSLNHDTYDDHENVAYAVAFRVLRAAGARLGQAAWRDFAYRVALPAMTRFRMSQDRHGVVTRGLFWMESSWNTAYLWENAEVAQAHLEAWLETGDVAARDVALAVLATLAHHHYGARGFLTEGVDWDNHVGQRHHVDFATYGAIRYTEPLLNNLHLVGPTLTYLQAVDAPPPQELELARSLARLAPLPQAATAALHLRETPLRMLLRLYYPVIADDASFEAALDFAQRAGLDGVLLFEASYDVDPALLTLDVLEERFRRLTEVVPRVRARGLEVHINVMITMGHVDDGGGHPEDFDFQFLVDEHGHQSRSTACPLDPGFLRYVSRLYHMAASCGADVVWVDDDVRFLGHDVSGMTCFCPLHLRAMSERTGHAWTREALVAALCDDGMSASLRQTWFDLQEEAMERLARTIEHAVHEVDPTQAVGLMTVGTVVHGAEGRRADRLLRVLSGPDHEPVVRPGAGFWHDWEPAAVLAKTEDVARQVAYLGDDVRVVAEIENHPYTPFQKSYRLLALEMALNILAGTHDLSLNVFSGSHGFRGDDVGMGDFLLRQRPFLTALRTARAGKRRVGVGIEAREDVARTMHLAGRSLDAWKAPRPWEIALARFGLPVGRLYDAPHLLNRDVVYGDRYALESMVQEGMVLTPCAVLGLLEQGWGDRLGVTDVRLAPRDVNERFTDHPLNGLHAQVMLPVRHYHGVLHPYVYALAAGTEAQVLSQWQDLGGGFQGVAAAALTLPDGARVGLLPFEIQTVSPALLQVARRDQWAALLTWVARHPLPVRVLEGVNIAPQLFVSGQGDEALLALVNLSADDRVASLDGPALDGVQEAVRLDVDGCWSPCDTCRSVPVAGWSVTALRLRYR